MFHLLDNYWRNRNRKRATAHTTNSNMLGFLAVSPPPFTAPAPTTQYLVLDLEMTGLDAKSDLILSAGWVVIENGQLLISSAQHHYIQQTTVDLDQSAPIHKIHHKHLENGRSQAFVLDALLKDLKNRVLVLHHAPLDKAFLDKACVIEYGVRLHTPIVDTLKVEHEKLLRHGKFEGKSLRLGDCRQRYNLPNYAAHNAVIDAIATAELWLAQLASTHANAKAKPLPLAYFLN